LGWQTSNPIRFCGPNLGHTGDYGMTILKTKLTFAGLVDSIKTVDSQLAQQASKAVNASLILWNWLIGIVEAAPQLRIDGKTLIPRLSFTHIVELLNGGRRQESLLQGGIAKCDIMKAFTDGRYTLIIENL
jgi:hypothetical protein